jgi:hypothetical protein
MNIDKLLPATKPFIESYNHYIEQGKSVLKSKDIVFVGLVRNLELVLKNNINKLVILGEQAKSYKVILFENDSSDNTKEILQTLSSNNNNIITISTNNGRQQYGSVKNIDRTRALAEYRNILKNYITTNFPKCDYTIVTDMDFIDFSDDGFYNSIGWLSCHSDTIDGIAGNSFSYKIIGDNQTDKSLWNYDSWAFRYTWWHELPNLDSMTYDRMIWFGLFIMPVGSQIIPVNSAFGGMCIYKTHQFIQGDYSGYDCEHVCFNYSLRQQIPSFQLVLNPSQRMLISEN